MNAYNIFYNNYFIVYVYTQSAGSIAASVLPHSVRVQIMCQRACRSLCLHTVTLTVQHHSHKMHDGRELVTLSWTFCHMHLTLYTCCSIIIDVQTALLHRFWLPSSLYFKQSSSLHVCQERDTYNNPLACPNSKVADMTVAYIHAVILTDWHASYCERALHLENSSRHHSSSSPDPTLSYCSYIKHVMFL